MFFLLALAKYNSLDQFYILKKLAIIMKKTYYLLTIILSFTLVFCNSQEKKIEEINFKTGYKLNSEIENKLKKNTSSWKHQASASNYSLKGDYKNALIQWDLAMNATEKSFTKTQNDSINLKYSSVNAKDYIIEQAKKNKIVIINEAHHNSFHRVFSKSLLQKLFDNGYKNLGLETLSYKENIDSLQKIRKYPILKTGYYIKEPQFGNFVREALQIGYNIFPYETKNRKANGKLREIDQAKNIQKVIDTKPNEKILIHCGFDHALEGNHKSWGKAMAERLKEYTGINPLTINQVEYSEKSKAEFNNPILQALDIKESSVLLDKDSKPLKYKRSKTYTDIAVLHPKTTYINNRPNWIFTNGNKQTQITLDNVEIEFPVMVLAFKKGENINNAVPIDITEVKNKTENCTLGLQEGNYNIVVTNGEKSIKFEQRVK